MLLFTLKLFFNGRVSCNNIYLVSSNVFCHEISQSCTNKTIKILKHSNQHQILGSVPSLHIYHMQYWYFLLFYYYDSQDMIHQYVMMMMSIRYRGENILYMAVDWDLLIACLLKGSKYGMP